MDKNLTYDKTSLALANSSKEEEDFASVAGKDIPDSEYPEN